jgi:hypothetical protein
MARNESTTYNGAENMSKKNFIALADASWPISAKHRTRVSCVSAGWIT